MDAHRFDSFARATARCTTRRQVLRVVAAGVLAGWLPRSARAAAFQEAGPCGGLTDCGGVCVELRGDPLNCGGCGIACAAGESCVDGGCLLIEFPPEAPTGCNEGLTLCNGECLVIDGGDPFNCGGCGVACAAGGSCFNGVCVPPEEVPPQSGGCGEGMPSCGGVCTDLLTDPLNCGACGVVCADSACAGGECGAPPGPCAPGFTDCGGSCVDLLTSNGNCGTCGTICELGETCGGGGACVPAVVACPDGQPPCGEVCAEKIPIQTIAAPAASSAATTRRVSTACACRPRRCAARAGRIAAAAA